MTSSPAESSATGRLYWACQLAGWGTYTVTKVWAGLVYLPLPWLPTIAAALALNSAALGVTHALRGYIRRRDWRTLPRGRLALRIALVGLVLGVPFGIATIFTPLAALQDPSLVDATSGFPGGPVPVLLLNAINWAFVFIIWLTLYFIALAVRQYRSAELRESELARALQLAELRLLK